MIHLDEVLKAVMKLPILCPNCKRYRKIADLFYDKGPVVLRCPYCAWAMEDTKEVYDEIIKEAENDG